MQTKRAAGMPQGVPYLFYDDIAEAVAFLTRSFGFTVRFSDAGPDGKLRHAQLQLGECVVMLGPTHSKGELRACRTPREQGSLNGGVYVFLDAVDAHHDAAKSAGVNVLLPPADMPWGDRMYCAEDLAGQFWMFATPLG